jgi:hypothetical protein
MLEQTAIQGVDFYLGDPKEGARKGLVSMLRGMGMKNIKAFDNANDLLGAVKVRSPDVLLISSDIHQDVFKFLKGIREQDIGLNPFTVISVMIERDNERQLNGAMKSGADDIMTDIPAAGQVMDRMEKIAFKRLPFIAMPDYIGPDRRAAEQRKAKLPVFDAINTLKDKIEGRPSSPAQLEADIADMMHEVRAAQLEGYSHKLGFLCNRVIKAYELEQPVDEIDKTLRILQRSLNKAATTAQKSKEAALSEVCTSFADKIDSIFSESNRPTERELKLLKTLTRAYQMARENISGAATPH